MKLIFCPHCQDVVKLALTTRTCECGMAGGRYLDDALHAEVWGSAIPLGFANSSLASALLVRPDRGMGREFTAFVIPYECPTVKLVSEPEEMA
jgi:hypothetical protein